MIYLQSSDNYNDIAIYNLDNYTYEITKKNILKNEDFAFNINGKFSLLNNEFISLFVLNKKIYLGFTNQYISINNITIELESKELEESFLFRKLIIKRDIKIIKEFEYLINKEEIVQHIEFTPFSEVEDFDFGLFIWNIFKSKKRQQFLLDKYSTTKTK